jgi:hypothetical protein
LLCELEEEICEVANGSKGALVQKCKVFGFSGLVVEPNGDEKASGGANELLLECCANMNRL